MLLHYQKNVGCTFVLSKYWGPVTILLPFWAQVVWPLSSVILHSPTTTESFRHFWQVHCTLYCTMTPPRSMFRRDRPILFQLPDEILQDRIMTLIPRPDLASLRLTSKLMYTLSTRSLYRILDFKSPAQIVKCCKVLIANPAYAELVRVFDICGPL